ncbi:MAG TPA: acyl carrier protein [Verrucomicrobiae bacterium]|jgi:acyl carrier protein|nr:acyl carrier protein [Verrucomicrobiae bacterium]
MDHREEIRHFLKELLLQKGDKQPFSDDVSLLLGGRLASVDAVEIVVFLEEKFGVNFAEIGFDQALIDSVDSIDSLIQTAKK